MMHKKEELRQTVPYPYKIQQCLLLWKLSGKDGIWGVSGHATVVIFAAHENVAIHLPEGWPGVFDNVIVYGVITHSQHLMVQIVRGVMEKGRIEGRANTLKKDSIEVLSSF